MIYSDDSEYLKIFADKCELVHSDGKIELFEEGISTPDSMIRIKIIISTLDSGFLTDIIALCKNGSVDMNSLFVEDEHKKLISSLVKSITSEVGRALAGLLVLQLSIKAIEPEQSIRLHKASSSTSNFSWKNGISMRTLDKKYITPVLRSTGLLRLNADGFMMTRSLAENYPYSSFYKANMKGARKEWLYLVEEMETRNDIKYHSLLVYLICCLINSAEEFSALAEKTITSLHIYLSQNVDITPTTVLNLIQQHINNSNYAARLMEISIHSLLQASVELELLHELELSPLSQMRSANKKHGNIGDIELTDNGQIIFAWDTKYGKTYLRDELEEINDKLLKHSEVKVAGFITSDVPERMHELKLRIEEIQELHGITISIKTFKEWVYERFEMAKEDGISSLRFAKLWLKAYTESIAQKRREIAPIDEPCYAWLETLNDLFKSNISN